MQAVRERGERCKAAVPSGRVARALLVGALTLREPSMTRDVEATLMRTWDSKGYKRVHYSLQIEGVSERRVHLIAYPRANLWYLTVESESEGTAVVPLFDAEYFSAMSTV
jgi:hypothetical protein